MKIIVGKTDLATTNPELVKEWDYTKNDVTPQEVSKGMPQKLWWLCSLGHSYEASPNNRISQGQGCPYCSGHRVLKGFNDIATTNPEILIEWDYEKNKVNPYEVSKGMNIKIWFRCQNNHSYEMLLNNKSNKRGCPYCSGRRVLRGYNDLATTHSYLVKEWDYEKNEISPYEVSYGSSKLVYWICNLKHSYKSRISQRVRGQGCPYCSNNRILQGFNDLATTHKELSKEWDYSKNEIKPTEIFKGSNVCVWWICPKKHSYKMSVNSRIINGYSCPYCSGQKVLKGYNDIATTNPELLIEWDYNKNEIKPTEVSHGSGKKIWWLCNKFHSYNSSIANKIHGCGDCPYCAGRKVWKGFNDLMTTNPELCKEWAYEKNGNLTPYDISKGTHKKVWWKCVNNHFFLMSVANRAYLRQRCPYCSGSKIERFLYDYLKREGILFQREKKFKDLYISYYPYDVYCKKENVIIEADGLQHFESIDFFTENISFKERVRRDNLKNTYCLNNNIAILRIPYIYDVVKDTDKIENLVMKFIQTKEVPKEIIEYYEKYDFSNYSKVVTVLNKKFKSY